MVTVASEGEAVGDPTTTRTPVAVRTLKAARWAIWLFLILTITSFLACLAYGSFPTNWNLIPPLGKAILLCLYASLIGLVGATCVSCLTFLLCFAQFTFGQVIGALLLTGLCSSLIVVAPGGYKLIPVICLMFLVFFFGLRLGRQDPLGERRAPDFIRRERVRRVRRKYEMLGREGKEANRD